MYGAQGFDLERLFGAIADCKSLSVFVALSIDGTKRSGDLLCDLPTPDGLFEREVLVNCGRSMLRRFQMNGQTLEGEVVADRLLLKWISTCYERQAQLGHEAQGLGLGRAADHRRDPRSLPRLEPVGDALLRPEQRDLVDELVGHGGASPRAFLPSR